jgi:hypothetical protein
VLVVAVSYWHRWVIAPPRSTLGQDQDHGQGEAMGAGPSPGNGPSGFLTVLFFMLDVWLMIVQV